MAISENTPVIRKRVDEWKNRLIDLSRRNQLLFYKKTKSSTLEIAEPGIDIVFDRIYAGQAWSFFIPPDNESGETNEGQKDQLFIEDNNIVSKTTLCPAKDELVCGQLEGKTIEKILKNLYRKAKEEYEERGVRVLHLGFGMLCWRETETSEMIKSPLLLCPVELVRETARDPYELRLAEEELIINPALQVKLKRDFNTTLIPVSENIDESGVSSYISEVSDYISSLGWNVEAQVALGVFSFEKLGMYQDLEKNFEFIQNHECINALCGNSVHTEIPDDILDPTKLDSIQKPIETFQILDADSSQQQCIQAVLRGQSIVLQGPPGTGKSQTISNIIAESMARGKSVLFVSEKMAALEVVAKRLYEAGLGDFCLELHSRKANKKEVISELYRCLEFMLKPRTLPTPEEYNRLLDLRSKLNAYVEAIHEKRDSIGCSVYEAISKVTKFLDLPTYPIKVAENENSQDQYLRWSDLVRQLITVWIVAEEKDEFPWLGCKEEVYSEGLARKWSCILQELIDTLKQAFDAAEIFAKETGNQMPVNISDIFWYGNLISHLEADIRPYENWLTTNELDDIFVEAKSFRQLTKEYWSIKEKLNSRYNDSYLSLEGSIGKSIQELWKSISDFTHITPDDSAILKKSTEILAYVEQITNFSSLCSRDSLQLMQFLSYHPKNINPEKSRQLGRLITICNQKDRPDPEWINTKKIKTILGHIHEVKPLYEEYRAKKAELLTTYDESFFELQFDILIEKFQSFSYSSFIKIFNPNYHKDKKDITRCTKEFRFPLNIRDDLLKARSLLKTEARLKEYQTTSRELFGSYYDGLNTNFNALENALNHASEIVQILDSDDLPSGIYNLLDSDKRLPQDIVLLGDALQERVSQWIENTNTLSEYIKSEKINGAKVSIGGISYDVLDKWATKLVPYLSSFCVLISKVLSCSKGDNPGSFSKLLEDFEAKTRLEIITGLIKKESQRLQDKFGDRFCGLETTWEEVLVALEWTMKLREMYSGRQLPEKFINIVSNGFRVSVSSDEILTPYIRFKEHFESQMAPCFVNSCPIFHGKPILEHSNAVILERLHAMLKRVSDLEGWVDYKRVRNKLEKAGLGGFISALEENPPLSKDLIGCFTKAFYKAQADSLFQRDERLREFRGKHHEQLIEEFRIIDKKIIDYTPYVVMEQCNSRRPNVNGFSAGGSEINILRREAAKSRRHTPIMRLFEKIPNLLLRIKPCLMMSPLSVSQFINPECFNFDVVIFDEASQIFTEDAIVAIYRGKQVVIAGDSKQMPPTNFFRTMDSSVDDYDPDEDDEMSSADFNSVLDECGTVLPSMMLKWHYRSKHESLIAFSNQQFYDSRLVTFPAAFSKHPSLGVHFIHVPDGIYDRGGRRANLREAQVVAERILEHFKSYPEKSLGIVAFSQAQAVAIEDEVEKRRLHNPQFERFFKEDRLEGFFIKNLENVQGDERDVIMFSVGYGRDQNGKMSMNFGPLNKTGGERRLNVAVTRAREKVVLISSIQAADIDVNTNSAGVLNLYHYLNYAEHGESVLSTNHPEGMGDAESPFEEDVASEIRQLGYQVVPQVGCSGYRIDIGVIDPLNPGKFILGVECDGATYHSAFTARDRDRLRQQILEKLGWKIHHIWSPEWFNHRNKEIESLKHAIENARIKNENDGKSLARTNICDNVEVIATSDDSEEVNQTLEGTSEYKVCEVQPSLLSNIDFHLPKCRVEQCRIATKIVRIEGPIHFDLVAKRLANAWGISKVGRRIRSAVEETARKCEQQGTVITKGEFLWPVNLEAVPVRVPVDGSPETIRNIEHIPDEEIYGAMLLILKQCIGMHPETLIVETARLFGFSKTGDKIKTRLMECFDKLQQKGGIISTGENVTLPR